MTWDSWQRSEAPCLEHVFIWGFFGVFVLGMMFLENWGKSDCREARAMVRQALEAHRVAGGAIVPTAMTRTGASPFLFLHLEGRLASPPRCPCGGTFRLRVVPRPAGTPASAPIDGTWVYCEEHGGD